MTPFVSFEQGASIGAHSHAMWTNGDVRPSNSMINGTTDDLWKLDGGNRQVTGRQGTAGLFTTFPAPYMSTWGSLLDQIIGTAILAGLICLITDKRHRIPVGFVPPLAGAIMSMVAMTFGANGGFAINPARDLGPRLFTLCAGYGWEVFRFVYAAC
ncbi:unnamed protein product [Heligmosomoides polygyrus]|uniref:Aquaporin-like protein n=1 Tax=Heligmosomoides polygyrus TaxID=6339 RepID=A0A183F5C4_HELPZ|nr:unnamed protein product [Heligmosomoides polygyrus]